MTRRLDPLSHGEHVFWSPGVGHRVGDVLPVGEEVVVLPLLHHEIAAHESANRKLPLAGCRRVETHEALPARGVELPADPSQRVALAKQKPVPEVGLILGVAASGSQVEMP